MSWRYNRYITKVVPLPVSQILCTNPSLSRSLVSLSLFSSSTKAVSSSSFLSVQSSSSPFFPPRHHHSYPGTKDHNAYVTFSPLSRTVPRRTLSTLVSRSTVYPLSSLTLPLVSRSSLTSLFVNTTVSSSSSSSSSSLTYPRTYISTYLYGHTLSFHHTIYNLFVQFLPSFGSPPIDQGSNVYNVLSNIWGSVALLHDKHENNFLTKDPQTIQNKDTDSLPLIPRNDSDPQGLDSSPVRASSDADNDNNDEYESTDPSSASTTTNEPSSTTTTPSSNDTTDKSSSSSSLFQRLWSIVKTQIGWLVTAAALSIVAAWLGILTPQAMAKFWDHIDQRSLRTTTTTTTTTLIGSGIRLVSLLVTRFVLQLAATITLADATERVANHLRRTLFQHFLHTDIGYFDNHRTAELVDSLAADVKEVRDSIRSIIGDGVPALAKVIGGAVSLVFISPKMTALLITTFVPAFAIGNFLANRLRKLARKSSEAQSKASATAAESLSHIRTVRAFTGETIELDKYGNQLDYASSVSHTMGIEYSIFRGIVSLGLTAIAGLVLGYGGLLVANGELTRGEVASFAISALSLENALETLSKLGAKIQRAQGATGRVVELLDQPIQANRNGGVSWDHLKGDVMYEDVRFAYPTRAHVPVLKGLTMHLPPGKVIAVVGPSGTGKSTLAHLLLRNYEPSLATTIKDPVLHHGETTSESPQSPHPSSSSSSTSTSSTTFMDNHAGMIRIDGIPLSLIDIHWFRKHIAVVPQDPTLFATTIKENIAYGRPDATDTEIERVAKEANALQFIQNLPHGMHTMVGDFGVTLSGGQKQRISLARALLRNPSILILDEATSALDAESEQLVQEALDRAMVGRTTLIIAHRLSTVKRADIIYVLSDGRVQEQGTHEELLKKKNGIYANLVARQRDGGEEVLRP